MQSDSEELYKKQIQGEKNVRMINFYIKFKDHINFGKTNNVQYQLPYNKYWWAMVPSKWSTHLC